MFEGFTPETIDFLWGIRMNNNRQWFTPHKQEYVKYLYEPMKALGQALFVPFHDRPGNILKVSRIYRDARLHHPLPYKEGLWLCIRKDMPWMAENPCLYFEIVPEGIRYGFNLWHPKTAMMADFRRDLTGRPGPFLQLIADTQNATGLPVTAECYKRPKFEAPSPELAPYFAWKSNISCTVEEPVSDGIFGPQLQERVGTLFEQLIPLYEYFNRFCL